jgi:hypothetical protein
LREETNICHEFMIPAIKTTLRWKSVADVDAY